MIDKSGVNQAGFEYQSALFLIGGYFLFLGIEFVDVKVTFHQPPINHQNQQIMQALGCKSKEGARAAMLGQKHGR